MHDCAARRPSPAAPLRAALAAISVLPADTRAAGVVRAEVVRQLMSTPVAAPAYELVIATAVEDLPGSPTATTGTVVVVTDFALTALATHEVVLSFGVRNEEAYPLSPDRDVTARARIAAEDHAARAAADLVVLHVAGTMETLLPPA